MILIIGGTGSLARAAANRFIDQGQSVRVMTRTPEKVKSQLGQGAEVVRGDLLDKSSLMHACDGAAKVLTAAHSVFGSGKAASKYVDLQGHIDCIDAAPLVREFPIELTRLGDWVQRRSGSSVQFA